MVREIIFYRTENGKSPIEDFFDGLSDKVLQKIAWVLRLISELDRIPATYFKKLVNSDDIYECRIQFGSNVYRIFCFFHGDTIIVLTHGIIKKTQKTPKQEIDKAESYKDDFLRRNR